LLILLQESHVLAFVVYLRPDRKIARVTYRPSN